MGTTHGRVSLGGDGEHVESPTRHRSRSPSPSPSPSSPSHVSLTSKLSTALYIDTVAKIGSIVDNAVSNDDSEDSRIIGDSSLVDTSTSSPYSRLRNRVAESRRIELEKKLIMLEDKRKRHAVTMYEDRWKSVFEFYEIINTLQPKTMKPLLVTFMAQAPSIYIKKHHFTSIICNQYNFINGEIDQEVHKFFNHFDRDGSGVVDYREIVCCIRILSHPQESTMKHLLYFFDVFDHEGRRSISREELCTLMTITCDTSEEAEHLIQEVVEKHFKDPLFKNGRISHEMFSAILCVRPVVLEMYEKIFWDKLPLFVHASVYRKLLPILQARFEKKKRQLALDNARKWWMPREMRSRWRRWLYFVHLRNSRKMGIKYWDHKQMKLGIVKLVNHRRSMKVWKEHKATANEWWRRKYKLQAFTLWRKDWKMAISAEEVATRRALRLYRAIMLQNAYATWVENAKLEKALKKAKKMWTRSLLKEMLDTWADNVDAIKEAKWQNERNIDMRQEMLFEEIRIAEEEAEAERQYQAYLAALQKEREEEAERVRLEDERRYKELMDEQRRMAVFMNEQGFIFKKQEQDRIEFKTSIAATQKKKFENDWDDFQKKAVEASKAETLDWLNNNTEGKDKLELEMKKHIQECDFSGEGTRGGEEGSGWVRLYSDIYGHMFYYNEKTELKYGLPDGLKGPQAREIATDIIVQERINETLKMVEGIRSREGANLKKSNATNTLTRLVKRRKATKFLRDTIKRCTVKRVDPASGETYYYNKEKKTSVWKKSSLLGKEDCADLPVYVLRIDPQGAYYYMNRISPWLTTYEKPKGYVLCSVCNLEFASIRCDDCKDHYCYEHFTPSHTTGKRKLHPFTEWPIVPATCVICKTKQATKLCDDCDCDTYCEQCYKFYHSKPARRDHVPVDI